MNPVASSLYQIIANCCVGVAALIYALADVSFLFTGMAPRTGFLERIVICAPVYLFPLATMLLVVLSLNPRFATGISPPMFHLPWTLFATLSLAVSLGFVGYRLVHTGDGSVAGSAHRVRRAGPSSSDQLARISTLSTTEQAHLALPARTAMQRFTQKIPAPNYTTKDNLKKLNR